MIIFIYNQNIAVEVTLYSLTPLFYDVSLLYLLATVKNRANINPNIDEVSDSINKKAD